MEAIAIWVRFLDLFPEFFQNPIRVSCCVLCVVCLRFKFSSKILPLFQVKNDELFLEFFRIIFVTRAKRITLCRNRLNFTGEILRCTYILALRLDEEFTSMRSFDDFVSVFINQPWSCGHATFNYRVRKRTSDRCTLMSMEPLTAACKL